MPAPKADLRKLHSTSESSMQIAQSLPLAICQFLCNHLRNVEAPKKGAFRECYNTNLTCGISGGG